MFYFFLDFIFYVKVQFFEKNQSESSVLHRHGIGRWRLANLLQPRLSTGPIYLLAMPLKQFRPGFRLSVTDTLVLVAGAAGVILLAQVEWWMGLIVGCAVGHFFLFCNVFRVARSLELSWSTLFVMLAGSTIVTGQPGWQVTIGTTLVATLLVIVAQFRNPSYHGVAWQRCNPRLLEWWETQGNARNNK